MLIELIELIELWAIFLCHGIISSGALESQCRSSSIVSYNNTSIILTPTLFSTLFSTLQIRAGSLAALPSLVKGFDIPIVMATIALQAFGGLIVAVVVKQTNSVVKGFAASGAVVSKD